MAPIRDLRTHPEPHVSVADLAVYWGVTERTVYSWITKGALPATRVGRTLRVKASDAIAFGRPPEPILAPAASIR